MHGGAPRGHSTARRAVPPESGALAADWTAARWAVPGGRPPKAPGHPKLAPEAKEGVLSTDLSTDLSTRPGARATASRPDGIPMPAPTQTPMPGRTRRGCQGRRDAAATADATRMPQMRSVLVASPAVSQRDGTGAGMVTPPGRGPGASDRSSRPHRGSRTGARLRVGGVYQAGRRVARPRGDVTAATGPRAAASPTRRDTRRGPRRGRHGGAARARTCGSPASVRRHGWVG